jgi:ABC-type multidrug transport system ATPase subunit
LDVIGTHVVFDYIGHLREEGKSVIVSTHRLDEAERLCDRFGLLHQGRCCTKEHSPNCNRPPDATVCSICSPIAPKSTQLGIRENVERNSA